MLESNDDDSAHAESNRLLAAAIYLMSCHARAGCPRLAFMVARHLELIGRHPGTSELVADTCRRLANAWVAVRRHDERGGRTNTESADAVARLLH